MCLIPTTEDESSFSAERKKYDRKAIATVFCSASMDYTDGEKVIYDDSDSIDFVKNGTEYSVVRAEDIVGKIGGGLNG